MKALFVAVGAMGLAGFIFAQSPKLAFDVVSIKPTAPGAFGMRIMGGLGTGGRFTANGVNLKQLVTVAYRVQDFQIAGGPSWLTDARYDIEAKPEAGAPDTPEANQQMLQAMLEERFHLQVRRETKNGQTYALVVAKDGPKLKLSPDQSEPTFGPPPGPGPGGPRGAPPAGPGPDGGPPSGGGPGARPGGPGGAPPGGFTLGRGGMITARGAFRASAVRMDSVVRAMTGYLAGPVVDRTNLKGLYDIDLTWTPDPASAPANLPPGADLPRTDPNGPTLFTAIQEQLGLKLESTTGPVESIVIEKAEKPTEN